MGRENREDYRQIAKYGGLRVARGGGINVPSWGGTSAGPGPSALSQSFLFLPELMLESATPTSRKSSTRTPSTSTTSPWPSTEPRMCSRNASRWGGRTWEGCSVVDAKPGAYSVVQVGHGVRVPTWSHISVSFGLVFCSCTIPGSVWGYSCLCLGIAWGTQALPGWP